MTKHKHGLRNRSFSSNTTGSSSSSTLAGQQEPPSPAGSSNSGQKTPRNYSTDFSAVTSFFKPSSRNPLGASASRPKMTERDSNVSPGSGQPISPGSSTFLPNDPYARNASFPFTMNSDQTVAPGMIMTGLNNHRRDLAVLQGPSYNGKGGPPGVGSAFNNHHMHADSNGSLDSFAAQMNYGASGGDDDYSPPTLNSHIFSSPQSSFSEQGGFESGPGTAPTSAAGPGVLSASPPDSYFDINEDRRPSIASVTTNASSTGSKSSVGRQFDRKIRGFFGEVPDNYPAPQFNQFARDPSAFQQQQQMQQQSSNNHSDTSLPSHRTNLRPSTPTGGHRPRTPAPSSDVVPFLYQDMKDVQAYGEAPVRNLPVHDKHRFVSIDEGRDPKGHSHGLHFHKKDRNRSVPFKPSSKSSQDSTNIVDRDIPGSRGRQDLFAPSYSGTKLPRGQSPTPSLRSTTSISGPKSPNVPQSQSQQQLPLQQQPLRELPPMVAGVQEKGKSSFWKGFRKQKHKSKDEDSAMDDNDVPKLLMTKSKEKTLPLRSELVNGNSRKVETMPKRGSTTGGSSAEFVINPRLYDIGPLEPLQSSRKSVASTATSKYKGARRGESYEKSKDPRRVNDLENNFFMLDTDLDNMEGVIQPLPSALAEDNNNIVQQLHKTISKNLPTAATAGNDAWAAPDSWAVAGAKKDGDISEFPEEAIPEIVGEDGRRQALAQFCVRIFRVDGSFTTLSCNLNATVTELLSLLGKKSFLQDDLQNYVIILRKQDLARILKESERPLVIQKKLLEQAGYTDHDRIDEIGREDHSYLCRFTFLPSRVGGHSLDPDQSVHQKMQKFTHVDLQGRNLLTIPIAYYMRAAKIVTLNLSRNLSLDVPQDFIQGCTALKEIKFRNNEATKLPTSFSHISRLTYLDVSNNRLADVKDAQLEKHEGLVALKMSNNRLASLPPEFKMFHNLRGLNLASNHLTEIPTFICELVTMVDLDVSFNRLVKIPDEIGGLKCLERLILSNNHIAGSLPAGLAGCRALKELDVRHNPLHQIDVVTELENLETLFAGHNTISKFDCKFEKIRALHLNNNKITTFTVSKLTPSLTYLNLSDGKLTCVQDDLCDNLPNLEKLILDKNRITAFPPSIGKLKKLGHLSCANNRLGTLPVEVANFTELRYLDLHYNNISKLPSEIWQMLGLQTLNLSSNILGTFPKPPVFSSTATSQIQSDALSTTSSNTIDELSPLDTSRRPSQQSNGLLSVSSSPNSTRKGSMASLSSANGAVRKSSIASKASDTSTIVPSGGFQTPRKDSAASNRIANTFAQSLRYLYLADNQLPDEVFDEISMLPELRVLNVSYNEIYDIPPRALSRLPFLSELYLSGNELTCLPTDDLENISSLKILHINGNKFQTLPAELGKIRRLNVLDVGSNALKYNISNWPYDWNWNWNLELRYLNLSGNKRLEIKANFNTHHNAREQSFTDFNALRSLRILGLMDVTTTNPSFPDQTEDCRVRTSGSLIKNMGYGMADTLGRSEHLSVIDIVVPRFRGDDEEVLYGFFDGMALPNGGSKVSKYLGETCQFHLQEELRKIKENESPVGAIRRTFLQMNKEIATSGVPSPSDKDKNPRDRHRGTIAGQTVLNKEDLRTGASAVLVYMRERQMWVANVGDAMAVLVQSNDESKIMSTKHDPLNSSELERIRETGGFVSRNGKLEDSLDVSRSFGYINLIPSVNAAPAIHEHNLTEDDEFLILASRELWDFMSYRTAVDIARTEREDLMRAAQKLRDFAIGYGATNKMIVMIIGVGDLFRKNRRRNRSASIAPGGYPNEEDFPNLVKRGRRQRDNTDDSTLGRLDPEVAPPEMDLCLVFTDIKGSTLLWETFPIAMRSAIKEHNDIMRRQLRTWGGYEVKTEGDAFMVCFPTVTSAMLWCFGVQQALLTSEGWPQEILNSEQCQEVWAEDPEDKSKKSCIFRGLSVRMGIHFGNPVCERDPITRRMDYFGPMVNRAARISGVADGGQITVSTDYLHEFRKAEKIYGATDDNAASMQSDDMFGEELLEKALRKDFRTLRNQGGYSVKELGERKLKGLENPEQIYLVYPPTLVAREQANLKRTQIKTTTGMDPEMIQPLFESVLKLEKICSALNTPGLQSTFITDNSFSKDMVMRKVQEGGPESRLMEFFEQLVSRVETAVTNLYLRTLLKGIPAIPDADADPSASNADENLSFTSPMETILTSLRMFLAADPRLQVPVAAEEVDDSPTSPSELSASDRTEEEYEIC